MNSKAKTLLVLLSVTLNVAFLAGWAWRAMRPAPESPAGSSSTSALSLHQRLELTPEQRRELEPRLEEFRKETAATFARIDRNREEMLELLAASQPDPERIRAKQQEIQTGQRQCQERLVAHILAEKEILSPEQQRKYFDLLRQQSGMHLPQRILGESSFAHTNHPPSP
jgi:Spy/CpxP family protein refolding chaperone